MQNSTLAEFDKEIYQAIQSEKKRQEQQIGLIASENYASLAVLEAQGSVLTNKYAEGYPHRRYYNGCEFADIAETLAISRAKKLFSCDYVNVQPHSGAQANAAVFFALMSPGDTLLGMNLSHGGHLTHGASVNFSGRFYQAVQYGICPETGEVDYQQVQDLAILHRPKVIVAGFSAYSRIVDWKIFRGIADKVGAYLVVDMAHVAGLVAAGLYPSPLPYAHVVTSTTHKTLRGPRGGLILAKDPDSFREKSGGPLDKKLNSAVFPGLQGGPLMHIIAAKAVAFLEALQPEFKTYQQQVIANAQCCAKKMQSLGYKIVSNGTDNHLFLIDLTPHNLTGKLACETLEKANITLNKNTVPNDKQSPFVASGLRLGSPAATTRGFKENEMSLIAEWIHAVLQDIYNPAVLNTVKGSVLELCAKFPVY